MARPLHSGGGVARWANIAEVARHLERRDAPGRPTRSGAGHVDLSREREGIGTAAEAS